MRLHRLDLTAFGPFAGTESVDFDELSSAGLFLLHGATGAGKTSILDGVCFALYGDVPGSRPASRLRSDHADAALSTEVVLELHVGGRHLEITRRPEQQRPKKRGSGTTQEKAVTLLRERSDGEWRALSKSHQEIGEELKQLIGMSREQFCQVVLLPQGEFANFLRATAAERGALLGRLFDTRRFKAVEEWLKERRRAAEQRIQTGDQELDNLAGRLAQAAGPGAEPLDDWLPEDAPARAAAGHADPAAPVLQWAAVLRSTARERHAIAVSALELAEQAHARARDEATAVQELYGLQQRHAAARRRADGIAGARSERDEQRARLERAHRASGVESALELREKAATQHQQALAARRTARAELPADLAEAAAEQLTTTANQLREELGSLTEAGELEQRATELAVRRDRLEAEARGDDEAVQEADGWLEGWEPERLRLQRRVDDAQAAAARAGTLDAERDQARRRLDAARERDRYAHALTVAEDRHRAARDRAADTREAWQDAREARISGIAAELAAALVPGENCRVCGSAEHPEPARPSDRQVTREDEDAAYAAYQSASAAQSAVQDELSRARAGRDAALAAAGDTPVDELAAAYTALDGEYVLTVRAAADTHAAREALGEAERERDRRTAERHEALSRAAARTSRREELDEQYERIAEQLLRARGGFATVAARRSQLARRVEVLATAAQAVDREHDGAQRLKEADAALSDAAFRAGFDTPADAARALYAPDRRLRLEHLVAQWRDEEAAVTADLAAPGLAAAVAQPAADPARARSAVDTTTARLREASAAHAAAQTRGVDLDRLGAQAAAKAAELAPARAEYARIRRLADLSAGTSMENQLKMELETYVLAARLEQVAAAASVRLQRMSSGRYTLVHSDARSAGRSRSGLGLKAVDAWTGTERDTSTLSGGETFSASLALALGLADVVTDEAGGTRLDTLFIDEGFGSLDEQTLDEVLDVLDALRERDRAVGIVSHVADLRQRIPAQLRVIKGQSGSTVAQGPAGRGTARTAAAPATT
ncbi:AAA family ATPase [Streptomyces fildesensis]|uniref:Nuclease SbcCD subunit C n=1 Tax=Streptomyces fildesensis TaxID=375757 RepID=A0ABW8C637_9ACTN